MGISLALRLHVVDTRTRDLLDYTPMISNNKELVCMAKTKLCTIVWNWTREISDKLSVSSVFFSVAPYLGDDLYATHKYRMILTVLPLY